MPTVELDIRQLADEGGTAPLAPITVTDAVLDEDGNTLTDILDELKSDLIVYRDYTDTTGTSQYQGYYFVDISYALAGYTLISATNLGSTSNRPAFVQVVTSSKIRAYCAVQETAVTVRCVYIKN